MTSPRTTGFTLIELLIVVAIIAILAAIAVPNFLEAQTRAKVSRAKADMRTMATAMEAYRVDNNRYPWPGDDAGERQTSAGGTEWFETRVDPSITTPIAYITSRLADPFRKKGGDENEDFHYSTKNYVFLTEGNTTDIDDYFRDLARTTNLEYFLLSHGPDVDHDSPDLGENPDGASLYDPTNGTVSSGDILYWGPGLGFRN